MNSESSRGQPVEVKRLSGMLLISLFLTVGWLLFLRSFPVPLVPLLMSILGTVLAWIGMKKCRRNPLLTGPRFGMFCFLIGLVSIVFYGVLTYRRLPALGFSFALGDARGGFLTALEDRDSERIHELMSSEYRETHDVAAVKAVIDAAFPGEDPIPFEDHLEFPDRRVDAVALTLGEGHVVTALIGMDIPFVVPFLVWDPDGGETVGHFGREAAPLSLAMVSRDGSRALAASLDNVVRVFSVKTGKSVGTFRGHTQNVSAAAFSPDGMTVLSGSREGGLRLWRAESGEEIRELEGHRGGIVSVAISPDGARALTSAADRTVRRWDLSTGEAVEILTDLEEAPGAVGFVGDGARIFVVVGKVLRVLSAETGEKILDLSGHTDVILAAAASPDGTRILTGSADDSALLWDARTGTLLSRFEDHDRDVTSVGFSSDGARAVSGGEDLTARVWDIREGGCVATVPIVVETVGLWDSLVTAFFEEGGSPLRLPLMQNLEYGDDTVELALCLEVVRTGYMSFDVEIVDFFARNLDRLLATPR